VKRLAQAFSSWSLRIHLYFPIQDPPPLVMAPKKRSQPPRPSGAAESNKSLLQQHQASTTLLSTSDLPPKDRRRRQRDSPTLLSSAARSPTQDRSPIVSDSPHSPIEGLSSSRRESSSTMRTSSISLDAAPSCTPTGRISKAKKGKRVHACEFPGCGKVSPNSHPVCLMAATTPKLQAPAFGPEPQPPTPG
jgi:hypothetical protein